MRWGGDRLEARRGCRQTSCRRGHHLADSTVAVAGAAMGILSARFLTFGLVRCLDTLDDVGALGLELGGVLLVRFLLALRDDEDRALATPPREVKSATQFSSSPTSPRRPTSHQRSSSSRLWEHKDEGEARELTSSSPAHLWSSSRRCLPQKWPLQNAQSPAIRWAASLHSLKEHFVFFAILVVGRVSVEVRSRFRRLAVVLL